MKSFNAKETTRLCTRPRVAKLFVGGDMKFLLLALGFNDANSMHACLYCKIAKENRHEITKKEMFYWKPPMFRSISDAHTKVQSSITVLSDPASLYAY